MPDIWLTNLPRYIDTTEAEDVQDIAAHLQGGIPQCDIDDLARNWDVFPGLRTVLFTAGDGGRATVETQNLASLPPLIDKCDVYQHLMAYWTETMQDDVYLIVEDGWLAANRLRPLEARRDKTRALKQGMMRELLTGRIRLV